MPDPKPLLVHLRRHIAANAERVFDAWLDPVMLGRWMFGPALREEEIIHLNVDPRAGGKFSFLVKRQGENIDHLGEYLVIERPRRLVFTWGVNDSESSRVTIEITPRAPSGCELALTHEIHPDWAEYVARTEAGWTKMIGVLDTLLASLALSRPPAAKAAMLIRKPAHEVFEAFVDPAITTRFWFTKSSGRLEVGKTIRWDWEMYGVGSDVNVRALEPDRRILVEWSGFAPPTTVEWIFTPKGNDATFVSITNQGFSGDGDKIVEQALTSTEGFTWTLAGLKALLEHGLLLNAVPDRHPDGVGES